MKVQEAVGSGWSGVSSGVVGSRWREGSWGPSCGGRSGCLPWASPTYPLLPLLPQAPIPCSCLVLAPLLCAPPIPAPPGTYPPPSACLCPTPRLWGPARAATAASTVTRTGWAQSMCSVPWAGAGSEPATQRGAEAVGQVMRGEEVAVGRGAGSSPGPEPRSALELELRSQPPASPLPCTQMQDERLLSLC